MLSPTSLLKVDLLELTHSALTSGAAMVRLVPESEDAYRRLAHHRVHEYNTPNHNIAVRA